MNKKILTVCAITSIILAVFSCKKEDDKKEETTSTTSTTATTSTTTTTTPVVVRPTPGINQLTVDTTLVDYTMTSCAAIVGAQGRYGMNAAQTLNMSNTFTSRFGKQPAFSKEYTITTSDPTPNTSTNVQLTATFNSVTFIAQSGKANLIYTVDSNGLKFNNISFKAGDSTLILSGYLRCGK